MRRSRRRSGSRIWSVGALAIGAVAAAVVGAGAVVVSAPQPTLARTAAQTSTGTQPAFYTWQAPGDAWTAGRRVIALTFDDGPGPYTPQVLSVLEAYHVPATFFEIGENVAEYPQYTQLVARAGYPVEDHTWNHPDLATLPPTQVAAEIDRTQSELRSLTGQTPACVRPPYDAWNQTVLDEIAQRGLTTMSYSIDPRDWSLPGVTAIVDGVVGAAFPGAVVDLHDGGGNRSETVAALPQIITSLRAEGYGFVSICGTSGPQRQTSAVYRFGSAPAAGAPVTSNEPFVGAAATTGGYWLAAADGGVFSAGVPFYGSAGGTRLNAPVVGMAATPDGRGYWLVASDGGVFTYGDARFYGSAGGTHLDAPVVGMAADVATGGYWLVAADGGVFAFGAPFYGSMGGAPGDDRFFAVAATPGGAGYLLAGEHPATPTSP